MRRGVVLSLAMAGLAWPAGAQAATPTCASLKGKDLAPGSAAKVVKRGGRTYVCTSTQQSRARALPGGEGTVLDARGAFAAVRSRGGRAVHVVDLVRRSRARVRFGSANPVGRVLVGAAGEAVGLFGAGSTRQVRGFDVDGTSYRLGQGVIPTASLRRVSGDDVRWDGGRADLREPRLRCADLAGREVYETGEVRVVTVTFRAEFLEGELDGTTTRTRACALDGDAVRVLDEAVNPSGGVQGGADFTVLANGGSYVLGRGRTEDSEATITSTLTVTDLATGRRTPLAGLTSGDRQPKTDAVLTAAGQLAVVVEDGETVRLLAQRLGGAVRELDAAPMTQFPDTTLTLDGTTVRWTRGELRSFDLAAL